MNSINAISPWDIAAQQAAATRLNAAGDQRAQFTEAARGFETLMIRKWIEIARQASFDPKEGTMASYQALGDDQLATMISRQGGVGFVAPMVEQMMRQVQNRVEPPGAQDSLTTGGQKAVAPSVTSTFNSLSTRP
jgi:Rod binding domain-containing protein